jgi:hypothetical protein
VDWDDPQWTERDDDAGAASRRGLQAWWRATVLELPAGPSTSPAEVNTLDAMVVHRHLTPEATDALHAARLPPRSRQP